MGQSSPLLIFGDIHGQFKTMVNLLQRSEIIDADQRWKGGDATAWFLGDFVDRGPAGLDAIDLVMRLQQEAKQAGGNVHALLGNHDVLLLAASRFGEQPAGGPGGTFQADWLLNGGCMTDLEHLSEKHIAWLSQLPALAQVDGLLLAHADAAFYLDYGQSIEAVNQAFRSLLENGSAEAWDALLENFSRRFEFDENRSSQAGVMLERVFNTYGGTQLVHGHTPISYMTGQDATTVSVPLVYAQGKCVNVDGGMYLGGPGVVYSPAGLK
jgi:hypothetical protein